MYLDRIKKLTKNLYPRGRAFKMPYSGVLDKLHIALAASENRAAEDAVSILNSILPDNDGFTVEDARDWERRLGLITNELVSLEDRKLAIKRKMQHPGSIKARQHYLYVQGQLQAAGFDVYVFENRFPDYPDGYFTITPESLFPLEGPELIVNGEFNDPSAWTLSGTGIAISGGELQFTSATDGSYASQELSDPILADSGEYRFSIRIGTLSAMFIRFIESDNTTVIHEEPVTGTGVQTIDINSSDFGGEDAHYIRLVVDTGGGGSTGVMDDASLKKIFPISLYPGLELDEYDQPMYINIIANDIDPEKDKDFDVGVNYRSTFFIGGTPLGTYYEIDADRIPEFRQLILKLKPAQTVGYLITKEAY